MMISYLNQFLPMKNKIRYIAWDMAKASKSSDQDVIGLLSDIADDCLQQTGFFFSGDRKHSQDNGRSRPTLQSGVVRTNCVDCLDRTNAAQFMIGKAAFANQLFALKLVDSPKHIQFDCDAVDVLSAMYQDHGDTIALQYGGSFLVNTMQTYRGQGGWTSHSRDMLNTIKRFYSNKFNDLEKQKSYNLFLGVFQPEEGRSSIWDLENDYHLHNDYDITIARPRRSYQKWWTYEAVHQQEGIQIARIQHAYIFLLLFYFLEK